MVYEINKYILKSIKMQLDTNTDNATISKAIVILPKIAARLGWFTKIIVTLLFIMNKLKNTEQLFYLIVLPSSFSLCFSSVIT